MGDGAVPPARVPNPNRPSITLEDVPVYGRTWSGSFPILSESAMIATGNLKKSDLPLSAVAQSPIENGEHGGAMNNT